MDDLHELISMCCKQLRLSSNLAERAMSQSGDSNQEYLYRLLTDEINYRRERRIMQMMNTYTPGIYGSLYISRPLCLLRVYSGIHGARVPLRSFQEEHCSQGKNTVLPEVQ